MDAEKTPDLTGKTLKSMILGAKFGALPLDIRRRFSQNYNTKVSSPYEAAWAIIYASNIEFESTLCLEDVHMLTETPSLDVEERASKGATFILSCDPLSHKNSAHSPLFTSQDELRLFPELSKLKTFLVRFLELSLRTPGAHLSELRLDISLFPNVADAFFETMICDPKMAFFLSHVRRHNWYQIIPGKIGAEPLYDTLSRAESGYPNIDDRLVWKDINTLLLDPGVRAYLSSFYGEFIQNSSFSHAKINEYVQMIENLPLNCVLM